MLRTILVHPFGLTAHLQRDGEFMNLRIGISATLVARCCIADQFVQIRPAIQLERELISKWVPMQDCMHALLMQTIDVDISTDRVPLSLGMGEPRRNRSRDTGIMKTCAPLSERAGRKGEREIRQ
jgi:hypothetical protein